MKLPIALQLYTIREETEKDFRSALEKVAEIGYTGVELAGYGCHTPKEIRKMLDDLGLIAVSSHVSLENMEQDIDKEIEDALELGVNWVIVPWIPPEKREDIFSYIDIARTLQIMSKKWKARGIQLCYHNHDFEFHEIDGLYPLDIIFENIEGDELKWQPDVFWIEYAGVDATSYLEKYSGDVPLVHIKDMKRDANPPFAEIGEGTLDMCDIIDAAARAGAEWLIVEQDACARPPLESVAISFKNLREMGIVD